VPGGSNHLSRSLTLHGKHYWPLSNSFEGEHFFVQSSQIPSSFTSFFARHWHRRRSQVVLILNVQFSLLHQRHAPVQPSSAETWAGWLVLLDADMVV
jgi:hypothetical protein